MLGKVISLLQSKPFMVPYLLLNNYKNLKITDFELIVIIYLLNTDTSFNPKQIANDLNASLENIMETINSLSEKDLVKIDIINKKVREEHVNLEPLYHKLGFIIINDKFKEEKTNIYDVFEKEFGRTLSPIDYEIINDWQEEFTDTLILLALKEAVYNGVSNLKYIDKIIRNWHKDGITSEKDIIERRKNFKNKQPDKKLFDYDWLNESNN
ncbi:MAG: DnaD domain protein [Bacilli bacterium]